MFVCTFNRRINQKKLRDDAESENIWIVLRVFLWNSKHLKVSGWFFWRFIEGGSLSAKETILTQSVAGGGAESTVWFPFSNISFKLIWFWDAFVHIVKNQTSALNKLDPLMHKYIQFYNSAIFQCTRIVTFTTSMYTWNVLYFRSAVALPLDSYNSCVFAHKLTQKVSADRTTKQNC